jgi:hypothetical protein
VTKDELIAAIRQSHLTEGEYTELFQVLFETMLGGSLIGMGMDMTTGTAEQAMGRWVPAPMCPLDHTETHGWRYVPGNKVEHEHWVES